MPTLTDRLTAQLKDLAQERRRIEEQALTDMAAVDAQITALTAAKTVITREVEQAYDDLRKLGLVREI